MDRYYLGKLLDDVNGAVAQLMQATLTPHLTFHLALDREVEAGDTHYKVLRYLFAVDQACPVGKLLDLSRTIEALCRRFSGRDYSCHHHFGHDDWIPIEGDGFNLACQFYMLDQGADHRANKVLVAGLLDDPDNQAAALPRWLHFDEGLERADLEQEVLYFCQHYVSRDGDHLYQVRNFEAAFWRVVNLACAYFQVDSYEELVGQMPARFHEALKPVPQHWHELRGKERAYSHEQFAACSRNSLRFCQQLMEIS